MARDSVAEQEDFETLNKLLIAKAEMNAKSKDYGCLTVLQVAAKGGHLEAVVKLMTAKAELNAEAAEYIGQTALQAAAEKGKFEIVDTFLVAKADVNAGQQNIWVEQFYKRLLRKDIMRYLTHCSLQKQA